MPAPVPKTVKAAPPAATAAPAPDAQPAPWHARLAFWRHLNSPSSPVPPLFRRVDWITFGVVSFLVFVGYWITLAPNLTLEDSGELAVASYYAGVPHPPGYPVWTIYTWLFSLIPFSNVAWRVGLSSAVAGALSCGLLALLVSRGSSLLLEGIPDFREIEQRWKTALCVVSGFVAGGLLGFNGFMWSQAVIVEVYTLSVLSFMAVLCCLFRWVYAPSQRKYLYWGFFLFGVCFTNHQTLIVASIGILVLILAASPRLGRDFFIGVSLIYILGLMAKGAGYLTTFDNNTPLFVLYNLVGLGAVATAVISSWKLNSLPLTEWKTVIIAGLLWVLGSSFYFYMPIASMTNPPMNWGYPRTVDGFFHVLTRGQYDKTNPTGSPDRFISQVWMYFEGAMSEFSMVYLLLGVIPFIFFYRMQRREQAWLIGMVAIWLCLAFLLMILLNPETHLQSRRQTRVFFTASHIILAMFTGYGLSLIGGMAATQYQRWRFALLAGGSVAVAVYLFDLTGTFWETQLPTLRMGAVLGLVTAILFLAAILIYRARAPLPIILVLFAIIPARSVLSNWAENEQRGHLFGYWFGHDMFHPPFDVYPEMSRNAILFGGTDPGRFNPTYMIFAESFTAPRNKLNPDFDRRDVYIITQNALADGTYLNYIRAHYNRSAQDDPYFFSELLRTSRERDRGRTNIFARTMLPLDRFFTRLGARVEEKRRERGVYPSKEIHTPTHPESARAYNEYLHDAQRRLHHDMTNPHGPRLVKPQEEIRIEGDRVQVTGQAAVMAINGLLTKIIFDKNPDHQFYLEESFPLEWMYPHLSPFGIIMKINREQLPELTEEMLNRDHRFWREYSNRLTGDWITYDTSIEEVCDFAERVYLRHDFRDFTGDRKFARDDDAQKAFSKLRSAIAGVYTWRLSPECPPELRPQTAEASERLLQEAFFALKQAYAFCPYSPEAMVKLATLLLSNGQFHDALRVAQTSLKFDPANPLFRSYVEYLSKVLPASQSSMPLATPVPRRETETQFRGGIEDLDQGLKLAQAYQQTQQTGRALEVLHQIESHPGADARILLSVAQSYAEMGERARLEQVIERMNTFLPGLEEQYQNDPDNVQLAFTLVSIYLITHRTNDVLAIVDDWISRPVTDTSTLLSAAQVYAQLLDGPRLEKTLLRLLQFVPESAETWYDLAAVQATLDKQEEALRSLRRSIELSNKRLASDPKAHDLRATASVEPRFNALRRNPEFNRLLKEGR
jgi:tetratricopeptide (TPR) repeat protein